MNEVQPTWADAETVTVSHRHDPRMLREIYTVSAAPRVVAISTWLLEQAMNVPEAPLRWEADGLVHWRFDNCLCRYRVVEVAEDRILCERLRPLIE